MRSAERAARAFASRASSARAAAFALAFASASAFFFAAAFFLAAASAFFAATSAWCCWASACASIRSARTLSMAMTWVRPVSPAAGVPVSAARAGEASPPMTPVVARAAMPTAFAPVRVRRLGARCFPVARVNAMKWLVLSFLLAYRVS